MLNQEDCEVGKIYSVAAQTFNVAIWTGEKFRGPAIIHDNLQFSEESGYWEPLPYGTCKPLSEISEVVLHKPFDGVNLLKVMYALDGVIELSRVYLKEK